MRRFSQHSLGTAGFWRCSEAAVSCSIQIQRHVHWFKGACMQERISTGSRWKGFRDLLPQIKIGQQHRTTTCPDHVGSVAFNLHEPETYSQRTTRCDGEMLLVRPSSASAAAGAGAAAAAAAAATNPAVDGVWQGEGIGRSFSFASGLVARAGAAGDGGGDAPVMSAFAGGQLSGSKPHPIPTSGTQRREQQKVVVHFQFALNERVLYLSYRQGA